MMVMVWLVPNGSVAAGENVIVPKTGVDASPIPERFATCVLPGKPLLLSVTVKVPLIVPADSGVKVTLTVQAPLTVTLPLQLSVSPNPALATMLAMLRVALPALQRVTGCDALVVPMS